MAVIDPAKAKARASYKHAATFYAVCADLAGGKLYAGGDDSAIYVFDLAAEKKEPIASWTKHDNYVSALLYVNQPAKPVLISGSYDRHLIWWERADGKPARSIEAHQGWLRNLAVTPDARRFVSVGDDMLVKV